MLPRINPTGTKSWRKLAHHFEKIKDVEMKDLFASDPDRFERLSIRFNDILVDYSKNRITQKTLELLLALAEEVGLKTAIEHMFDGEAINETGHSSLRRTVELMHPHHGCAGNRGRHNHEVDDRQRRQRHR